MDVRSCDNFNFLLFFGVLNYQITPKFTTTLGYGYADIDGGFNTDKPHTYEKRVFEQLSFKHKLTSLPIDHRFRAKQRFLRKRGDYNTQHRLQVELYIKTDHRKKKEVKN